MNRDSSTERCEHCLYRISPKIGQEIRKVQVAIYYALSAIQQSIFTKLKLPDNFCKEFKRQSYENLTDGLVADITSQSDRLSNGHSVHTRCLAENGLTASQLMLHREIIAVCSQIHTKHINTLCGQNVKFVSVKLSVHTVTTGLLNGSVKIWSAPFSSLHLTLS